MPIRSRPIYTGRTSGIEQTAVALTSSDVSGERGVQIFADSGNTGILYVGEHSTVTADVADSTDGYPIAAGETVVIPTNRPDLLYVISSADTNKLWWMLV